MLRCPAGDVVTWQDGDLLLDPRATRPGSTRSPAPSSRRAAAVDALDGPPPGEGSYYAWAWIDEPAGTLRARYFVPDSASARTRRPAPPP